LLESAVFHLWSEASSGMEVLSGTAVSHCTVLQLGVFLSTLRYSVFVK